MGNVNNAKNNIGEKRATNGAVPAVLISAHKLMDHVYPVKTDIGVSSATSGAWRIVNRVIQRTNAPCVKKDFGEIHARNVKEIVLIRANRNLVSVEIGAQVVSGEIIATTLAVTDAMGNVRKPRGIVNSVNHKHCMDLFVIKSVAQTVSLTNVIQLLANVRKVASTTSTEVDANTAAV